jgi:N-acetylmuramoyl-L-alanine amidase
MQSFARCLKRSIEIEALKRGIIIVIAMNRPEMSLGQIVKDSDTWGADAHLALHTNAGPQVKQNMEIFAHADSGRGVKFANGIAKRLAQIKDIPIRGDRDETPLLLDPQEYLKHRLAEVDKVKAPACLIELVYHTNQEDLDKLHQRWMDLIEAIRDGVLEYVKGVG